MIPLGSNWEGAEVITADRNARAGRQGERKYSPACCLFRRPAPLVLEAMSSHLEATIVYTVLLFMSIQK